MWIYALRRIGLAVLIISVAILTVPHLMIPLGVPWAILRVRRL